MLSLNRRSTKKTGRRPECQSQLVTGRAELGYIPVQNVTNSTRDTKLLTFSGLAASRVICLVNSCQSSGFDSREVSPGKNGRVWNESEKTIKLLRANANRYGRTMDAFMYFEHPVLTVRYHTLP